jgi:tetratricopeptide (TPR) repeat protein
VRDHLVAALDDWLMEEPDAKLRELLCRLTAKITGQAWRVELAALWNDQEQLEAWLAQVPLAELTPGLLAGLGERIERLGGDGLVVLEAAKLLHPTDFWVWFELGLAYLDKGKEYARQAAGAYGACVALRPESVAAWNNLGTALWYNKDVTGAIAAYKEAIRLDPKYAYPRNNLGTALWYNKDVTGAIAAFKEAIRLDPKYAMPHNNLGNALHDNKDFPGAIAAYREAIRLDPKDAYPHNGLGMALRDQGDLPAAIAACKEAIRLDPKFASPHYNLGNALRDQGDLPGAITAFQQAIALKPEFADAHLNLGLVLRRQGEFAKSLAALRRGHELGSKDPRWPHQQRSAQWVRQVERLVELDGQLPGFLEGKTTPASAEERIELAKLCSFKRLHRAAARFYEEACAAQPKLLAAQRYNAACAAALAGCGRGEDAAKLDDRKRLRSLALGWLRDELTAWAKQLENKAPALQKVLRRWQHDPDLAGVRDEQELAKLPTAERQAWQQLWADVDALLARANKASKAQK